MTSFGKCKVRFIKLIASCTMEFNHNNRSKCLLIVLTLTNLKKYIHQTFSSIHTKVKPISQKMFFNKTLYEQDTTNCISGRLSLSPSLVSSNFATVARVTRHAPMSRCYNPPLHFSIWYLFFIFFLFLFFNPSKWSQNTNTHENTHT